MGKANLHPDFREVLESLNSAKARYLVLGGYAVIHYGHRRVTDDLDIWIAVDSENTEKVASVLQSFGGFSSKQVSPGVLRTKGRVFIFGREPVRVDILTTPSGVSFDESYQRREMVDWDGVMVPLISFDDLRRNKAASGRVKDLADLENLARRSKRTRRGSRRGRST